MNTPRPRALRLLSLLGSLAFAGGLQAATVVIDDFNYGSFLNDQTYWTRTASSGDNAFITPVGTAVLRSRMTQAEHTSNPSNPQFSVLVSNASDQRFNFFTNSYTVSVNEITLSAANLDLNQSFFRISLSSTNTRQFSADDAITMRLRYNNDGLGGLLLFGYKMNQTGADAEVRIGADTASQSLNSINFTGTIQNAGFTLETVSFTGTVANVSYSIFLTTSAQTYTASGFMLIDQAAWGNGTGFAALALESRRNSNAGYNLSGDSDAQATVGSVTYTVIPEPSSFAALAGLGMLGAAVTRRRRA